MENTLLNFSFPREGNINLVDSVKEGIQLLGEARHLIQDGFSYDSVNDAKHLISGARDFFKGLQHRDEQQGDHLESMSVLEHHVTRGVWSGMHSLG